MYDCIIIGIQQLICLYRSCISSRIYERLEVLDVPTWLLSCCFLAAHCTGPCRSYYVFIGDHDRVSKDQATQVNKVTSVIRVMFHFFNICCYTTQYDSAYEKFKFELWILSYCKHISWCESLSLLSDYYFWQW